MKKLVLVALASSLVSGYSNVATATTDDIVAGSSLSVRSVSVSTFGIGKGRKSGRAVVVETDEDVNRGSLRESLRLRPDVLRRLGWHYLRVHSFELFADPDAVASRIARLIGADDEATTDVLFPKFVGLDPRAFAFDGG